MELIPHLVPDAGPWVEADPAERQGITRRLASRHHVLLADLAIKLGDTRRAEQQVRDALQLDPGNRTARRLERLLEQPRAR